MPGLLGLGMGTTLALQVGGKVSQPQEMVEKVS